MSTYGVPGGRPGPGLDGRAQGAEGPAAVGGGVLGRLVDLGAGPVPAVGDEHRVVAESQFAPRLGGDRPFDVAERGDLTAVGEPGERDRGDAAA